MSFHVLGLGVGANSYTTLMLDALFAVTVKAESEEPQADEPKVDPDIGKAQEASKTDDEVVSRYGAVAVVNTISSGLMVYLECCNRSIDNG